MYKEKLEEAAKKYSTDRFFENDGDVSKVREISFIAGANWALENQWRDARKELPEDNEQVIGRYFIGCEDHNCHEDKIVYSQDNGKDWFTDFGGIAFDINKPNMWMPIPSLPEELK